MLISHFPQSHFFHSLKVAFPVGPVEEMSFKGAEIVACNQFTPRISAFQRLFLLQFSSTDKFLLVSVKSQAKNTLDCAAHSPVPLLFICMWIFPPLQISFEQGESGFVSMAIKPNERKLQTTTGQIYSEPVNCVVQRAKEEVNF